MTLLLFVTEDDRPVGINPAHVVAVRPGLGDHASEATVVDLAYGIAGGRAIVRGKIEDVLDTLNGRARDTADEEAAAWGVEEAVEWVRDWGPFLLRVLAGEPLPPAGENAALAELRPILRNLARGPS